MASKSATRLAMAESGIVFSHTEDLVSRKAVEIGSLAIWGRSVECGSTGLRPPLGEAIVISVFGSRTAYGCASSD